jgi:hypothetical protein
VDERHPVLVRDCGGIGAVYSEVELEEFVGPAAEARLQDLAWLGPQGLPPRSGDRAGDEPRSGAAGAFCDPVHLAGELGELRRLNTGKRSPDFSPSSATGRSGPSKGCWIALPPKARCEKLSQPAAAEDRSPGARYFEQKRIKAQAEREFNQRLKEHCRQTAAALERSAGGFRERKAMPPEEGGAEAVLNWAFLLAPAEIAEFRAALERLHGDEAFPGLRLALTGPWPPYSFVPISPGARG